MKKLLLVMVLALSVSSASRASDFLGGTQGMACKAMLCLSAPAAGGVECVEPLAVYYAIRGVTKFDTELLRKAFLAMCPLVSDARTEAEFAAKFVPVHAQLGMNVMNVPAAYLDEGSGTYRQPNYYFVVDTPDGAQLREKVTCIPDDRGLYINDGTGIYRKAELENERVYLTDYAGNRTEYVLSDWVFVKASQGDTAAL